MRVRTRSERRSLILPSGRHPTGYALPPAFAPRPLLSVQFAPFHHFVRLISLERRSAG